MPVTSLSDKLRVKYEAEPGVDTGQPFADLERQYFQVRSGLPANPNTPKSEYMHKLFDDLALPEGRLDYRQRHMFILESAATNADGWQDAAHIWADTP